MPKRGNRIRLALYFSLILLLLLLLALHAFRIYPVQADFFTKYLIGLLFVLLLLPMVPYVKIFDLVEMRRESRILSVQKKRK